MTAANLFRADFSDANLTGADVTGSAAYSSGPATHPSSLLNSTDISRIGGRAGVGESTTSLAGLQRTGDCCGRLLRRNSLPKFVTDTRASRPASW